MRQIDIARKLNISVSTVSRILNNVPKSASAKLTEQVWQLAHQGNYKFNINAQSLRTQKNADHFDSNRAQIHCLFARSSAILPSSFFQDIVRGFELEALKNKYTIFSKDSVWDFSAAEFKNRINMGYQNPLLVLGRINANLLRIFEAVQAPILQVGLNVNDILIDRVLCNAYQATKTAISYLYFCGHRNIAYFGETQNEIRYFAYQNQMQNLGLLESQDTVFECEQNKIGGYRACENFLDSYKSNSEHVNEITAIFCANDETALGVYKKLNEKGMTIPEQISIIGIDDIDDAQEVSPMLTTMQIPKFELGKIAAQTLISRIEGRHTIPLRIELPFKLVIRESVLDYFNHTAKETRKAIEREFK